MENVGYIFPVFYIFKVLLKPLGKIWGKIHIVHENELLMQKFINEADDVLC